MRILAIDTALDACSAAVVAGGAVEASESLDLARGHAERLLPLVQSVMRRAGCGFEALDRIAVTVGPGSFTGIRIGLAAARAIGLAIGKPVVGVTTLEAVAAAHSGDFPLMVAFDARREEVYAAVFADGRAVVDPAVLPVAAAAALARETGARLVGSGAELVRAAGAPDATVLALDRYPAIERVAALAAARPVSARSPGPLYLRPADAKPQAAARIPRVGGVPGAAP